MKLSVGDKVRFLNEKGEGIVSKLINKTTVAVTIEEGFDLPFLITELIAIAEHSNTNQNVIPSVVESSPVVIRHSSSKDKEEEGIFLGISPEKINDISQSDFNLWLINHSEYEIMYCCSNFRQGSYEIFDKGESKAFDSKIIFTIHRKKLDDFSTIKLDVLFYKNKKYDNQAPISEIIKIKQARLYKENVFTENTFIPEKALIINVSKMGEELFFDNPAAKNMDLSKLLFQKKTTVPNEKISKPHTKNSLAYEMEIDLHIEELMDNYNHMSNAEIIQVQLKHFQQALDTAIKDHCRSLTVIHGVGNGRLKQEVRSILSANNIRFHDGSYAKYGFGATEVVIG